MKRDEPEQLERIKKRLSYNPETGVFIRIVSVRGYPVGSIAGSIIKPSGNCEYIEIGICGYRYYAHVLAWWFMTGEYPRHEIDHRHGKGTINIWDNLRPATRMQNATNVCKHSDGKNKYKGVYFDKSRGLFRSEIMHNGKRYALGRFVTEEQAFEVYKLKSIELHKEFGTLRGSECQ